MDGVNKIGLNALAATPTELPKMLCPVRCFSCGRVLADKYLFFDRERTKKLAAIKAGTPDQYHDARSVAMGDVLDALGLPLYCCRSALMTSVDLTDVI